MTQINSDKKKEIFHFILFYLDQLFTFSRVHDKYGVLQSLTHHITVPPNNLSSVICGTRLQHIIETARHIIVLLFTPSGLFPFPWKIHGATRRLSRQILWYCRHPSLRFVSVGVEEGGVREDFILEGMISDWICTSNHLYGWIIYSFVALGFLVHMCRTLSRMQRATRLITQIWGKWTVKPLGPWVTKWTTCNLLYHQVYRVIPAAAYVLIWWCNTFWRIRIFP